MKKVIRLTEGQLKNIIENTILKENHKIISIQRPTQNIDMEKEFRGYKYAIPEHPSIKLSNGNWLHTYRVTKYGQGPHGDPDEEQDAFEREMY